MILIAYDGTDSAKHAVAVAGALLGARRAHVLHVWQPLASPVDSLALAAVMPTAELLAGEAVRAQAIAEEGAERARVAGFDAAGESVESTDSTAEVIEAAIVRLRPEVVVVGSRGLTGLSALLKGSVSHHVCAHTHAPVLVVPLTPE